MSVLNVQLANLLADFNAGLDDALPRQLRPISEFAVQEIILPPGGPYENEEFSIERQPFARLWFDLIESGEYVRFVAVGPLQSGKTLLCFVIPLMYHLFEVGENVACGIPEMVMAMDKWERDIKPVILASRYANLLPDSGQGSEGGKFESITFKNGATLKFLSAKGGDSKRSGFTARVLVLTEVDKYDEASETSREADPVTQMLGRLEAFEVLNTLVYMECSVSIETGRIWTELLGSTNSRIVLQCPHCCEYSTLEREHLVGWQDAGNEIDARAWTQFGCPKCGELWTEEQRIEANKRCRLLHHGQQIDKDGVITGEPPKTLTAGFRWNAANSLFKPAADIGWKEWKARFAPDELNSEKGLLQFLWTKPVQDAAEDVMPLNVSAIFDRTHPYGRGIVPPGCEVLTVGLDLGGWRCHWTAIAYGQEAHGYVIDYGRIAVPQETLGLEAGLTEALRLFRDLCAAGWTRSDGGVLVPEENLVDSGWMTDVAYQFVQSSGSPFRACKGLSVAGEEVSYKRPKSTGAIVQWIGDGWHIARLKDDGIYLVEIDANAAKSLLHARLNCAVDAPGAITLFEIDRSDNTEIQHRRDFVRQLTAEKSVSEFIPGRGTVTRWVKIRKQNHHLDSTALALIGGSIAGVEARGAEPGAREQAPAPAVEASSRPIVRRVRSSWIRRN